MKTIIEIVNDKLKYVNPTIYLEGAGLTYCSTPMIFSDNTTLDSIITQYTTDSTHRKLLSLCEIIDIREIPFSQKVEFICSSIQKVLCEKNKRYGDAALSPLNIFSKIDSSSSICIRLDDKLNRVKNSSELRKNDIFDLMGYLMLLCVSREWVDFSDLID